MTWRAVTARPCLKESVNINSGLLALGNVISALSDDQDRKSKAGHEAGALQVHVDTSMGC